MLKVSACTCIYAYINYKCSSRALPVHVDLSRVVNAPLHNVHLSHVCLFFILCLQPLFLPFPLALLTCRSSTCRKMATYSFVAAMCWLIPTTNSASNSPKIKASPNTSKSLWQQRCEKHPHMLRTGTTCMQLHVVAIVRSICIYLDVSRTFCFEFIMLKFLSIVRRSGGAVAAHLFPNQMDSAEGQGFESLPEWSLFALLQQSYACLEHPFCSSYSVGSSGSLVGGFWSLFSLHPRPPFLSPR